MESQESQAAAAAIFTTLLPALGQLAAPAAYLRLQIVISSRGDVIQEWKILKSTSIIPTGVISQNIYFLRGAQVLLDIDLARLYGVTTSGLNKAVRRNLKRFPEDFMFQASKTEAANLRFQSGISSSTGHGGRRYLPFAFTEQGVAMLSSVLRSERAVTVNIAIMRAFVQLREILATNQQLRRKVEEMERRYDAKFQIVFTAIKRMLEAPMPRKDAIGFHAGRVRKPQPKALRAT
jgi:ORF6N domain